jgi:hypothetical protein
MKAFKVFLILCGLFLWLPSKSQTPARKLSFVNHTEVGGLFGRVSSGVTGSEVVDNKLSLSLQTFNGLQFSKRLAVGTLVSVDWYKAALLMPLGAGLRYQLTRPSSRNVSVFASADAGYAVTWLHKASAGYELQGGWMINPGVGFRFGKPDNGGLTLTFSYKRQEAQVQKPLRWNEIIRDESRMYNRLALRLGLHF